ncbi:S1 family peptidase [Actinoplanes couchii]|uniref:Serine protease n=1 Tax=Actinoplanes couchii TaxID=403638 RepID=A0ABQ3XU44_9ACTN|nr:serine protease [Actinoplanes couchii]MDR6317349.1 V8-like Glu-specific endopeptidase [Actinoplanes couchii]GID62022.1 serine protease [Actinoplanes couchii]
MRLRRAFSLGVAALTAAAGVLAGTAAPAQADVTVTLANTIALSNCSASLVRFPTSVSTDSAMMLTNGHCYEGGFIPAGRVIQNVSSTRSGTLLNSSGGSVATVRANRVLYATMTGTDVTLYRLNTTFANLSSSYGATPLTISAAHPTAGTGIGIPSGYWKRVWNCSIDGFVPTLRESTWTWTDSVRYNAGCDTIGGTSGSPIVSTATGDLIGINNTGNEDGASCTLNNPCEVSSTGVITVLKGRSYGQQTYWFTTCLNSSRAIDLTVSGCLLPKP